MSIKYRRIYSHFCLFGMPHILNIERDRLRKNILERMGWHFYRVWSTNWFRNKRVERTHARLCKTRHITQKGFLYVKDKPFQLRIAEDGGKSRNINDIAIEELAAGLLAVIKHNVAVEKTSLYKRNNSAADVRATP